MREQASSIEHSLLSLPVGHVALSFHHASHRQLWGPAEGHEVHRGLWNGGLNRRQSPFPSPQRLHLLSLTPLYQVPLKLSPATVLILTPSFSLSPASSLIGCTWVTAFHGFLRKNRWCLKNNKKKYLMGWELSFCFLESGPCTVFESLDEVEEKNSLKDRVDNSLCFLSGLRRYLVSFWIYMLPDVEHGFRLVRPFS